MPGCLLHSPDFRRSVIAVLWLACLAGCSLPTWKPRHQFVLEPGISKSDLVAHLNQNILGNETRPRVAAWRAGNCLVKVSEIPIPLQASVAVEAPRNFRLMVSRPVTGTQEVDLGSNAEKLWIWTNSHPTEVMTVRHEDVATALQQWQFPVEIHPDWMMQVFGVIPIEADQFELVTPEQPTGEVELVERRASQFGEDVERVIRVNLRRGYITEHSLRLPGGKTLVRAVLDNYTVLPSGVVFPQSVVLQWPDEHIEMALVIRNPEINPANLTQNSPIWQVPRNVPAVDLGMRRGPSGQQAPISHAKAEPPLEPISGRTKLKDTAELDAPEPASTPLKRVVPAAQSEVRTAIRDVPVDQRKAAAAVTSTPTTKRDTGEDEFAWARDPAK